MKLLYPIIFMYPAKLLEIYKRKMISHGGQIDKATNLVREFIIPLSKMTEQISSSK